MLPFSPGVIASARRFVGEEYLDAVSGAKTFVSDLLSGAFPWTPVNIHIDNNIEITKVKREAYGPATFGGSTWDTLYTATYVDDEILLNGVALFTLAGITDFDIDFDNAGYPVVSYTDGSGLSNYTHQDTAHTLIDGAATNAFIVNVLPEDVNAGLIVGYEVGTDAAYRLSHESYATERIAADLTGGGELVKMGIVDQEVSGSNDVLAQCISGSPYLRLFAEGKAEIPLTTPPLTQTRITTVSPDRRWLAVTTSATPYLIIYDLDDLALAPISLDEVPADGGQGWPASDLIHDVKFNPSGTRLVAVSNNNVLMTYDTSDWSLLFGQFGSAGDTGSFEFYDDSTIIRVSFYLSPVWRLRKWDILGGGAVGSDVATPAGNNPLSIKYSPNGDLCAVTQQSGDMQVFDTTTEPWVAVYEPNFAGGAQPLCDWSPDGALLALTYSNVDPRFIVANVSDWSTVSGLTGPNSAAYDVFFWDDKLYVSAQSGSDYLFVYNTSDWSRNYNHPPPNNAVFDMGLAHTTLPATIPTPDHHYPLDEVSGDIYDVIDNVGYTAPVDAVYGQVGVTGTAIGLAQNSASAALANVATMDMAGEWYIGGYIKNRAGGNPQYIFKNRFGLILNTDAMSAIGVPAQVKLYNFGTSSNIAVHPYSTDPFIDGEIVHLAARSMYVNPTTWRYDIFVNGVVVVTGTYSDAIDGGADVTYIGRGELAQEHAYWFDDIRMYKRALSSQEALAIIQQSTSWKRLAMKFTPPAQEV